MKHFSIQELTRPAFVKMDLRLMEFLNPDRKDYELVNQVFMACLELDTDDFTSSDQYAVTDPRKADPDLAREAMEESPRFLVDFINLWKTIPVPPAYRA